MTAIVATIIAQLLDPIRILLAIIAVVLAMRVWKGSLLALAGGVVVVTLISELLLHATQLTRMWHPAPIIIGLISTSIIVLIVWAIGRAISKSRARSTPE
jgi:hypothetical protein